MAVVAICVYGVHSIRYGRFTDRLSTVPGLCMRCGAMVKLDKKICQQCDDYVIRYISQQYGIDIENVNGETTINIHGSEHTV